MYVDCKKKWSHLRADVDNLLVKTEKKLKLWSMDINIRWGRVFGRDPRRRGSMYERGTPWPAQG